MKNYLTLCLLCCMAFVASSYSVPKLIENENNTNSKDYVKTKMLVFANTVSINLNNSTGTALPNCGVYLKQNGNIVMTLYYPIAPGVNFYTNIPAGTYEVEGFFLGSNSGQYLYGLPMKGSKCGGPESNFGNYQLNDYDQFSIICILASQASGYPFCANH